MPLPADGPTRFCIGRAASIAALLLVVSCGKEGQEATRPTPAAPRVASARDVLPLEVDDSPRIPSFEAGRMVGWIGEREARTRGMVIVDLGDRWAPSIFSEDATHGEVGEQPYLETFLALADQRFGQGPEWERAKQDRYLELFGIFPTFRVHLARLSEEERHVCHDRVDDRELALLVAPLRPLNAKREVVTAIQAHLTCDALLSRRAKPGIFDAWTMAALKAYQRRHMIVSWGAFDDETRTTMLADSRELDFRGALRALRERVADSTGLIEDGSASSQRGAVRGRILDARDIRAIDRERPLPNGAPDLISKATDEAARALGWEGPHELVRFFEAQDEGALSSLRVAVRLPPLPRYHASHMELRAEIDRGDVRYEFPYTHAGVKKFFARDRRPTLVLYAKDGDAEVALVRWNTTIGGWQPERAKNGWVAMKYKESPAGRRVWRDVISSPAWLPPDSTPNEDLLRRGLGGRDIVNTDLFGPGYASAYGLTMLVNHRVIPPRAARPETVYWDEGIRAHGSASYASILRSQSHGCHRLFNHLALRLSSFVLTHRTHVRHGEMAARYVRDFVHEGRPMRLRIKSRGYRFELTPPLPVSVLEGRVVGKRRAAPTGMRLLPEHLAARARAASED